MSQTIARRACSPLLQRTARSVAVLAFGLAVIGGPAVAHATNATVWSEAESGSGSTFHGIQFVSGAIGYASGTDGILLKSTDGGFKWKRLTSGTSQWLEAIDFTSAKTGYAVGGGGVIQKTTNAGAKWKALKSGTTQPLWAVDFFTTATGVAVGDGGIILRTTNAGKTWKRQTSGVDVWLDTVDFVSNRVCYATGAKGLVLKSTNGGTSWRSLSTGVAQDLWAADFVGSYTGWAVGKAGTILKTTDGGQSWFKQAVPSEADLRAVEFIDSSTGWVGGVGGAIWKTSDGGSSWVKETVRTKVATSFNRTVNCILARDRQTLWAGCDYGTILRFADAEPAISASVSPKSVLPYPKSSASTVRMSLKGSIGSIVWGGATALLEMYQYDDATGSWLLASSKNAAFADGGVTVGLSPTVNTRIGVKVTDADGRGASTPSEILLRVKPSLSKPKMSRVGSGRYRVRGVLKPWHPSGSRSLEMQRFVWRRGKWVKYGGRLGLAVYDSGAASAYSTVASFPKSDKAYGVVLYHNADERNAYARSPGSYKVR